MVPILGFLLQFVDLREASNKYNGPQIEPKRISLRFGFVWCRFFFEASSFFVLPKEVYKFCSEYSNLGKYIPEDV